LRKISAPAFATRVVLAAVPTDTDALSPVPLGDAVAQFIDDARHFVSWNARVLNSGPRALFREHVTVADATGFHLDAHLSWIRLRDLTLDDSRSAPGLEICATFIGATAGLPRL